MNQNKLDKLNKRYRGNFFTGFKLVKGKTTPERIVEDISCDVEIFNSTDSENRCLDTIKVKVN